MFNNCEQCPHKTMFTCCKANKTGIIASGFLCSCAKHDGLEVDNAVMLGAEIGDIFEVSCIREDTSGHALVALQHLNGMCSTHEDDGEVFVDVDTVARNHAHIHENGDALPVELHHKV